MTSKSTADVQRRSQDLTADVPYPTGDQSLPVHNGQQTKRTQNPFKGIRSDGESGRKGIHPWHFFRICFRSSCTLSKYVNVLWPVVPVAFALHWARPEENLWNFILPYLAMIPAANLLGFAGACG